MLNSQRQKFNPTLEDRNFAKIVVALHFLIGICCTVLLVLHELFPVAIAMFTWFLLTVGLIAGMMAKHEWCRPLLALMFFGIAAAGFYYLTRMLPHVSTDRPPILTHKYLPLWGAAVNVTYVIGGFVVAASPRIKKATARGFGFW